ncbi:hypothetical protein OSB04_001289 [Centaurea solstitialis]|uniref:Integrase catalytic domain-containing protein n=1 Tax=Centaurea solstitialis TaxID=347529 RepID=A0AA38TY78_9ASTR|nr:hypothetical protein OSB04_001289 [Centaurea solstitialis]
MDIFRKLEVNIPLLDAIKQVPRYAKFLKELCTNKKKLIGNEKVSMGENVSAVLQGQKMPLKCKDPGMFTIPCKLGNVSVDRAMVDLGASINVMPYSIYSLLNVGPLERTGVVIQLASRSIVYPKGVLEDVLVQVNELVFPADFHVIDMEEHNTSKSPLILLGRPFLKTSRTKIDVHEGTLNMEFDGEVVKFNIYDAIRYPSDVSFVSFVDVLDPLTHDLYDLTNRDLLEVAITRHLDVRTVNMLMKKYDLEPDLKEMVLAMESDRHKKFQAPKLELKELPSHLKYAYLGKDNTLPVIISTELSNEEEQRLVSVLEEHKEAIGWTIADIKGLSPSVCMHKILLEDDYKPFREAQRCLNPPMMEVVKKEILKLLDAALKYLMKKKDAKPRLIRWMLLLQEFDLEIRDKSGSENLVADHLSRLLNGEDPSTLKDEFLDEHLLAIQETTPWYADIVNYLVMGTLPGMLSKFENDKIKTQAKFYVWDDPYLWKHCSDQVIRRCVPQQEVQSVLRFCHEYACGGHFGPKRTAHKVLNCGLFWPSIFKDAYMFCKSCDRCQKTGNIGPPNEMPQNPILVCEIFDVWGIDFMEPFPPSFGFTYILLCVDYVLKWVQAKATRTDDARTVSTFLRSNIFARFGTPRAIISDRGTHFCNKVIEALFKKYYVTHRISTAYHLNLMGKSRFLTGRSNLFSRRP